ncbi:uncharacterized protein BO88DRAFT_483560, partial [Aspergillus vadensis CBS 113365]
VPELRGRKRKEAGTPTPTPTLHLKLQKKIHGKFISCSSYFLVYNFFCLFVLVPTSHGYTSYYSAPLFGVLGVLISGFFFFGFPRESRVSGFCS